MLRALSRGEAAKKAEKARAAWRKLKPADLARLGVLVIPGAFVLGAALWKHGTASDAPRAYASEHRVAVRSPELSGCNEKLLEMVQRDYMTADLTDLTHEDCVGVCALLKRWDSGEPDEGIVALSGEGNKRFVSVAQVGERVFMRRLEKCDYPECPKDSTLWTLSGQYCYEHTTQVAHVSFIGASAYSKAASLSQYSRVAFEDAKLCRVSGQCKGTCLAKFRDVGGMRFPEFDRELESEELAAVHFGHGLKYSKIEEGARIRTQNLEFVVSKSGKWQLEGTELEVRKRLSVTAMELTEREMHEVRKLPRLASVLGFERESEAGKYTMVRTNESGDVLQTPLGDYEVGTFNTYTLEELRNATIGVSGPIRLVACGPTCEPLDEKQEPVTLEGTRKDDLVRALVYRATRARLLVGERIAVSEWRVGVHVPPRGADDATKPRATLQETHVLAHVPQSGDLRQHALTLAFGAVLVLAERCDSPDVLVRTYRPTDKLFHEELFKWDAGPEHDAYAGQAFRKLSGDAALLKSLLGASSARDRVRVASPDGRMFATADDLDNWAGTEKVAIANRDSAVEKDRQVRIVPGDASELKAAETDTKEEFEMKRARLKFHYLPVYNRGETYTAQLDGAGVVIGELNDLRLAWPVKFPANMAVLVRVPREATRYDDVDENEQKNRVFLHNLLISYKGNLGVLRDYIDAGHARNVEHNGKMLVGGSTVDLIVSSRTGRGESLTVEGGNIKAVVYDCAVLRTENDAKREPIEAIDRCLYVSREGTRAPNSVALLRSREFWSGPSENVSWELSSWEQIPEQQYRFVAMCVSEEDDLRLLARALLSLVPDQGGFAIEIKDGVLIGRKPADIVSFGCVKHAKTRSSENGHPTFLYGIRTAIVSHGIWLSSSAGLGGIESADLRKRVNSWTEKLEAVAVKSIGESIRSLEFALAPKVVVCVSSALGEAKDTYRPYHVGSTAYVTHVTPGEPQQKLRNCFRLAGDSSVVWTAGNGRKCEATYDGASVTLTVDGNKSVVLWISVVDSDGDVTVFAQEADAANAGFGGAPRCAPRCAPRYV